MEPLKKQKIIFVCILALFLTPSTCIKNENIDAIKLRVVWVINEHSETPSRDEQKIWLENIRKFYYDEVNVQLEFQNIGHLNVKDFFRAEFDQLQRSPFLEAHRFDFNKADFSSKNKEAIVKNLKRIKLQDIRKIAPYGSATSYEDIFQITKKNYLDELAIHNNAISRKEIKYHSAINWLYILQNTKKYDLIFTNETIINDSHDPNSPISMLQGALAKGFAVPNRAVISTAALSLYPKEYRDKLIQYFAIHEIGHAVFYISHSASKPNSVMTSKPSWNDIDIPKFTDKERNLIAANLLMRIGERLYKQRDYQQAIEKYNEALIRDPNCYLCTYFLSQIHCDLRDYDTCSSYLELTTRLNPTWSLPHELLGDIYLEYKFGTKIGGLDRAIEKYKRALELEPYKIELHFKLAKCYEEAGERKKAEKEYLAVIRIEPTNSSALQALTNLRAKRRSKE